MSTPPDQTRHIPKGDTSLPGELVKDPAQSRRSHINGRSLIRLSWRLQPRDYVLAQLLDEHRVLTTDQIASVLFPSPRTCANRLGTLRRAGFIDSFIPVRTTTLGRPVHWVPGLLSARYVALSRGEAPPTARYLRERQDAMVANTHLAHTVGANQFFIDLLTTTKGRPHTRLARWWGSARTAAALGRRVRPDGHGVWVHGEHQVGFFVEHDTGTETLGRLAAKVEPYARLRRDGGPDYPLLFWLPATTRETNLHKRLAAVERSGLTVATAVRDHAHNHGPAGAVWRVIGNGRRRLTLAELPSRPGEPGPYHPGPATTEQHPLYLLHPAG